MSGLLCAALIIAGLATPVSPSAVALEATACVPLAMIALRGSGETLETTANMSPFDYIQGADGWEGEPIHRALKAYEGIVEHATASSIPVLDIGAVGDANTVGPGYAATAVVVGGNAWWPPVLFESASKGAQEAVMQIDQLANAAPKTCSATQYVVLGYSQGAIAARAVAQMRPDIVVGTVLFGDPLQKPFATGNEGTGWMGNGAVRAMLSLGAAFTSDAFYDRGFHRSSVCHFWDPVCNLNVLNALQLTPPAHLSYAVDDAEAATKGIEIADLVRRFATVKPVSPPLDILILFNEFQGHGNPQRQYLINALSDLEALTANRDNVRFSAQSFDGRYIGPTDDIDAVRAFMQGFGRIWDQYPQKDLSPYLLESIDSPVFFRADADRAIIGVDQDQYRGSPAASEQEYLDQIAEKLSRPRIAVHTSEGQLLSAPKTRIYNGPYDVESGGLAVDPWASEQDFIDLLHDILGVPRAILGIPPIVIAGQDVFLTSAGSKASSSFTSEFTFGSAAAVLSAEKASLAEVVSSGETEVKLTVVDANGVSSTVTTTIDVIDPASLKIPLSPETGAPTSDASLFWDGAPRPGQTGSISVDLTEGAQVEVRLLPKPEGADDPFLEGGSTLLSLSDYSDKEGVLIAPISLPSEIIPGSYLILVRESTGQMVQHAVTVVDN